jgi:hypothetical protein
MWGGATRHIRIWSTIFEYGRERERGSDVELDELSPDDLRAYVRLAVLPRDGERKYRAAL